MELTTPGPTLGIVGGGQLGRMLGEAAGPLGVEVVVSDPTPDCPAAPVVAEQVTGGFDDRATVRELAERADILTYEIELADPDVLDAVSEATGTPVHPDPSTLRTIQDKLVQNRALADAGAPVSDFRRVDDVDDLRAAGDDLGWPLMLKARRGGYDGRGNVPVDGPDDAAARLDEVGGGDALAEELVDFERELAVIGVRGSGATAGSPDVSDAVKGDGETDAFPVTETVHREEILRETVSPARTDPGVRERAHSVATAVLDELDGRGVYGIELFEADEEILVNEIAPRPHNSGHWTIEGCDTSQFEQHVRAVLGWPLGSVDRRCPTALTNLLADVDKPQPARLRGVDSVLSTDRAALHWYGKREARPLRKMGHVTITGEDADALLERARDLEAKTTFA